ncbi:hypothetical protein [Streptomyces scabiei]|uniref:hypothetical protein n=1 Tax=Streptomyces scabiei TaxID=1930 RepID=UPI001B31D5CB|nr:MULTISPECIES: hypothetical protein [unclassified Streptomyces]MBP5896364.1 hypothetical protein [Streptomyces sp. LBUM 1481]MBP5926739.1 hypothetical protein [Streptomyces sp. LBUM 1483]
MPAPSTPSLDQLFNLVARAERKGGLNADEGTRLRTGLRHLAEQYPGDIDATDPADDADIAELRRKYKNLRKTAWRWKRSATALRTNAPTQPPPPAPVDEHARDALHRVTALAQRWTHIPAKRQAGASVLAAITNRDPE